MKLPPNVAIADTVDGEFMILIDGVQWGPPGTPRDRSGAAATTFATPEEAATSFLKAESLLACTCHSADDPYCPRHTALPGET